MSRKRQIADLSDSRASSDNIYTSTPINDRSSTFIGRYSPTANAKTLQASPDFKDASHRMSAWRKPSSQRVIASSSQPRRQLYDTGFDDDGEQYGGKRLERLLDHMQVEGAVVVSRWYGGVMLGPIRFTHIESCAREAILQSRKVQSSETSGAEKKQRIQEEDDAARKSKLEHVLQQRDQSIDVLRGLLAEKTKVIETADMTKVSDITETAWKTPVKIMDYSKMPLAALIKLEKARDATIGFLLEQISKAEAATASALDAADVVDGDETIEALRAVSSIEVEVDSKVNKYEIFTTVASRVTGIKEEPPLVF